VCTKWHAVVPFKSFAQLLLLPFGPESDSVTFYSISEEEVISVPVPDMRGKVPCGASHGWLALMDKAATVTLVNPFTGAHVELLPVGKQVSSATRVSFPTTGSVLP
jgi:hypothetical protein